MSHRLQSFPYGMHAGGMYREVMYTFRTVNVKVLPSPGLSICRARQDPEKGWFGGLRRFTALVAILARQRLGFSLYHQEKKGFLLWKLCV